MEKQIALPARARSRRVFGATLALTLCLLLLGGGFLLADANTRAVTFGDGTLSYAVTGGDLLCLRSDGGEAIALRDLLPAPLRAASWILDWERTVLRWLVAF